MQTKGELEAAFNEAYASLNAAQKDAVDSIEGPVMVVAGPGTGKTQILTLRIANILLQTDTKPDGVLALTFTESGAKAMRERLRRYVGAAAYQVPIFTFHGFAQMLISDYPDAYEKVIGARPAGDLEKIAIIEEIINDGVVKLLRPMGSPSYYVPHVQRIIGQLKQEYVSPDGLVEIITEQEALLRDIEQYHSKGAHKGKVRGEYSKLEKTIAKNRELVHIYRRYEALLREEHLFDFDDMITETVHALEHNESMLRDLQERYLYLLADEHQDVNGAQNKILELLASYHDQPNIFAVGDEKQAIYRFQGASLENFLYFTQTFKNTKVISLVDNYRSGQTILDAAHSLVAVEDGPLAELRIPLKAKAVATSGIAVRTFSHQAVEDEWLATAVTEQIAAGIPPEEIAVIVRTNREVEAVSSLLRKAGLAVTASADGDILRHPITTAVEALMQAYCSYESEAALFTVLHGAYWGILPDDLLKVLSARSYKQSLIDLISDAEKLQALTLTAPESVLRVAEVLREARAREVHEAPQRVLEHLLEASGFITHVMTHDPVEGGRVVRRLYDEIQELVLRDGVSTTAAVLQQFAVRKQYGLPLNAPYIATNIASVQVMTAHKSKGLEFAVVFIPHLVDSTWSGTGKKRYFDIPLQKFATETSHEFIEDERRLLYVAMTRAKHTLCISSSDKNADGRELVLARLLEDVAEETLTPQSTEAVEAAFDPVAAITTLPSVTIDAAVLQTLFLARGFSATSLNNYLRSPWDYFYRNLLRIPETQPAHMQFGTAVHNTLEYMTGAHIKTGDLPNMTAIKQKFEQELDRLPLVTTEYSRLLEKGLEELAVYREHLERTLPTQTKEELTVRVVLETGIAGLEEIPLTGKLDRLDLNDAGEAVRVVDYKTGKPKSRNAITGDTKNDDGGYKRQLVFYALLLELQDDDRYRCREGVLSFVQSDAKGEIKEESFVITDEEIAALKADIIAAAEAIVSGAFLSEPCEEGESDYYHLAEAWRR